MSPETTVSEIRIAGANCPLCLNETLDALRDVPGVVAADASIADGCVRVEHRGVEPDDLVALVRQRLHADDLASTERVMTEVDAQSAELHCVQHADRPGADEQ
jgi:hypothetical protein